MSNRIYTPSHVANFFLKKAHEEEVGVTQLKLLKLVYIGYGWVSAVLDRTLFNEPIEAWRHGPVVESLYHEFKHYGKSPIACYSVSYDLDDEDFSYPEIPGEDKEVLQVLSYVWEIYKRFSGWALRNKTHEPNTPWSATYDESVQNKIIEPDLIKLHFTRKIQEYLDER